jgi:hypothetical protein
MRLKIEPPKPKPGAVSAPGFYYGNGNIDDRGAVDASSGLDDQRIAL